MSDKTAAGELVKPQAGMRPLNYQIMFDVEDEHWWYVGRRAIVLAQVAAALRKDGRWQMTDGSEQQAAVGKINFCHLSSAICHLPAACLLSSQGPLI